MSGYTAIWINHVSSLCGDGFIRLQMGEATVPGFTPQPAVTVVMTNEVATELCRLVKETIAQQAELKQQKYSESPKLVG